MQKLLKLKRWKKRLENLTEIQLPTDYPRPSPLQVVEAVQTLELPKKTVYNLLALGITIFPKSNDNESEDMDGNPSPSQFC